MNMTNLLVPICKCFLIFIEEKMHFSMKPEGNRGVLSNFLSSIEKMRYYILFLEIMPVYDIDSMFDILSALANYLFFRL